jgi:hypothetical protein
VEVKEMKKVINPFTFDGGGVIRVFCEIEYKEGRLSITGVEGPLRSGNCIGSSGQIDMGWFPFNPDGRGVEFSAGWGREMVSKFFEVWDRWHLNDMRAGTARQEAAIREWKKTNKYEYTAACEYLKSIGLFEDSEYIHNEKPYKYGYGWLKEEIPQDVLDFLESLPVTTVTPAWV